MAIDHSNKKNGAKPPAVLLMAMAPNALYRADVLRAQGVPVDVIGANAKSARGLPRPQDKYALDTQQGRHDFIASLELPQEQSARLESILEYEVDVYGKTREELTVLQFRLNDANGKLDRGKLAELIQYWAIAEKGGKIAPRFLLAGHGDGQEVYGAKYMYSHTIEAVLAAMPEASKQADHAFIASCYSVRGKHDMFAWRSTFPNASTVSGYLVNSRASDHASSETDMLRWEACTRVAATKETATCILGAPATKKELNAGRAEMAVWSRPSDLQLARPPEDPAIVEQRITNMTPLLAAFFSGAREDTSEKVLRAHYNDLHYIAVQHEPTSLERQTLVHQTEVIFRLMKYSKVREVFQKQYGAQVGAAFQALGLAAPDFATLSRREAMEQVAQFEDLAAAAAQSSVVDEGIRLVKALRDLDDFEVIRREAL